MQSSSDKARAEAEQNSLALATEISDLLLPMIKKTQLQLQQLSEQDDVTKAFESGDKARLKKLASQYLAKFDQALNLRFFLKGSYDLDYESKPNLGFASIELLKKAEKSEKPSQVETHIPGSDNEHIVFIQPVKTDGSLLGLIHLSLSPVLYQEVLQQFKLPEGFAELQQFVIGGRVELVSLGDQQFKAGSPFAEVAIPGTQWKIAHWSEAAVGGGASTTMLFGALLALILAAMGLWYFLGRSKNKDDLVILDDEDAGVIYQGAVKAIMDGAHPGVEKLVTNLPRVGQSRSINPIAESQASLPEVDDVLTEDTFDITAAPAEEQESPQAQPEPEPVPINVDPAIFRAYDIRGIVGHTLTPEIVEVIGKAIGSEAIDRNQTAMAVGRDGRTHGAELVQHLIKGIASTGINVFDIGMVPTPVLYFSTHHLNTHSGVMLTGSHNPPDYNGMKIMIDGESLSGESIKALYDRIQSNNLKKGVGEIQEVDVKADYIRRITDDIPVALGNAFKIVIDAGNGVAGELAIQLYRALGHEVIDQYCEVDGNFPNHHPDPSQPDNLKELINRVKQEKADLGFAFDGDGDRLGIVDSAGNIIWPDRQMILLAEDVLKRNSGASIIYDVKCTRYLQQAIEAAGGKPLMWKTGHSLIKTKMKEVDAPLAGEMSGHIFFKERWYGFDDALYTGARILEILTANELGPAEVFAFIPEDVSTPELRVRLDEMEHVGFMEEFHSQAKFDGAKVVDIDGLRADYPNGWGLVRPSNTSPYLVMRFEAEDSDTLERIMNDFKQQMLKVKSDLDIPF